MSNRQPPDAISLVPNDNDRAAGEFFLAVRDYLFEPRIDRGGCLIPEAKDHDARSFAARRCQNVAEIQIKREDDPALAGRLRRDLRIGKANQSFVAEMDGVMTGFAQYLNGWGCPLV